LITHHKNSYVIFILLMLIANKEITIQFQILIIII